jgi:hypothetical protein
LELPIPDHNPIRIGTLNSILRLLARHKGVEREEILRSLKKSVSAGVGVRRKIARRRLGG